MVSSWNTSSLNFLIEWCPWFGLNRIIRCVSQQCSNRVVWTLSAHCPLLDTVLPEFRFLGGWPNTIVCPKNHAPSIGNLEIPIWRVACLQFESFSSSERAQNWCFRLFKASVIVWHLGSNINQFFATKKNILYLMVRQTVIIQWKRRDGRFGTFTQA